MSEREPIAFEDGADLHMAHGQVTSKGEIERATGAAEGFFQHAEGKQLAANHC